MGNIDLSLTYTMKAIILLFAVVALAQCQAIIPQPTCCQLQGNQYVPSVTCTNSRRLQAIQTYYCLYRLQGARRLQAVVPNCSNIKKVRMMQAIQPKKQFLCPTKKFGSNTYQCYATTKRCDLDDQEL